MIMIPSHGTSMIPLYTVKLDTMSGGDMGPGVLQKIYMHVVGFFEQHMSRTTNTICMYYVVYELCNIQ